MKRTLGTCYYPEHWPEDIWAEDARRMVECGLTWVRIGEFAWSRIEPKPGKIELEWLDRAIDVLGAAGLKVVLGTPTATPPRWLLNKHPDMLAIDAEGRPREFGSRRHYCFSHRGYRTECARIVTLLAERYGQHPHVHAWQTDNEYGCHDTTLSYSDAARHEFRNWLAQRYQSPQALNRAWGNVFWSMEYDSFDEIGLPNLTVTEPNPAHVMAFRRFASDGVISFNRLQVHIIRAHSDRPIAHNYMGRVTEFDHFAVGEDLDIASWDSYPLGFLSDRLEASEAHKQTFLRQGDPDFQAFHHDLYRAVGAKGSGSSAAEGRWWVMEQQPGPVNWAPWNAAPLPGMARLWAWEAFAHGAEAVLYFRWRQAPFAQEQMHAGLLRPDSAPAPAFHEAAQVAGELTEMPDVGTARADVALIFDYASAWAWEVQPQGQDFDYFRLVFAFYRALRRLGLNVDILPPDCTDLSGYKLVLAPGIATLPDPLKAALESFGGSAILGPRTHSKTAEMAIPVPLPPALDGIDIIVSKVESLPPGTAHALKGGGEVRHWLEHLEGDAEMVELTTDGHKVLLRSGWLSYLGGWPCDTALTRILADACREEGIATTELPEGLRLRDSATHRFAFNYGPTPVAFQDTTIPPAGVQWWPLPAAERSAPNQATRVPLGTTQKDEDVERVTIRAGLLTVSVLNYGAILQDIRLDGVDHNLTCGGETLADYDGTMRYAGAIVGPVANRLRGGAVTVEGKAYQLEANDGHNTLHSGTSGTHAQLWQVERVDEDAVILTLDLADGVGGFPGNRTISAIYSIEAPSRLRLDLSATTDAPTLMNLANHSYWCLGGPQKLQVAANRYLPTDDERLPTGQIASVEGKRFDFRTGRLVGSQNYDHCLCLADKRGSPSPVAWLSGDAVTMELRTSETGLQVYDGNPNGIALEAQSWPDAPSFPDFPSILLQPGKTYRQTTSWTFTKTKD